MEKKGLPDFFNYKEENTENGYESMQDFFLSWSLRCAKEEYKLVNPLLNEYCRKIVYFLIHGENNLQNSDEYFDLKIDTFPDFKVKNVSTKRQWNRIDLLAEIEVEENEINKKYVLNIENKWYSSIIENQLEKSKSHVEEYYSNADLNGDKIDEIVNLIIFCDHERLDNNENDIQHCINCGYKFLAICDLKRLVKLDSKTNNYLFDEYWLEFHG